MASNLGAEHLSPATKLWESRLSSNRGSTSNNLILAQLPVVTKKNRNKVLCRSTVCSKIPIAALDFYTLPGYLFIKGFMAKSNSLVTYSPIKAWWTWKCRSEDDDKATTTNNNTTNTPPPPPATTTTTKTRTRVSIYICVLYTVYVYIYIPGSYFCPLMEAT